jgi:hypothetical protein
MTFGIWIDVEINKALLRLREVKALREVRNGKQKQLLDPGGIWQRRGLRDDNNENI